MGISKIRKSFQEKKLGTDKEISVRLTRYRGD